MAREAMYVVSARFKGINTKLVRTVTLLIFFAPFVSYSKDLMLINIQKIYQGCYIYMG
jgi:hypothetical protein